MRKRPRPIPGWPVIRRLCGPGLSVSDDEALQAMAHAFLRLKLVAEPGDAESVADIESADEDALGGGGFDVAAGYRPLDSFWRARGYAPLPGVIAEFSWKDVDGREPSFLFFFFSLRDISPCHTSHVQASFF